MEKATETKMPDRSLNGKRRSPVMVLVISAMLTALYVVLSMLAIRIGNLRITVDSLPIVVAGALLGPWPGLSVGLLGNLIEQLLLYGLGPTTVLWIIADGVRGLIIGLYAKHHKYNMTIVQTIFISVLAAVVVTIINTAALYVDSKIGGYYTDALIWGGLVTRFLTGMATSAVIGAVLPQLLKALKKSLDV